MAGPTGEADKSALRLDFDRRLIAVHPGLIEIAGCKSRCIC
jgi:hypothetical protein